MEAIPFSTAHHARTFPTTWAPAPLTTAQLARLNAGLREIDPPSFAVIVRGEELTPATNAIDLLDRMISEWQQQGLPGARYAILFIAWSDDCAKPKAEQRPGHNRCEYALSVGWGLRKLGIQPARDAASLAAPYLAATSESPIDLAGGILKTLQGISELEKRKESWVQEVEDGSRPRALAALDRTILLANHLRSEGAGSKDETLASLILQATNARQGSIQRISAADEALQTYLNSLIRIGEAQRSLKARGIMERGILIALILMMLVVLGLVARKRWEVVRSIADPLRDSLRKMREDSDSILRVTKVIEEEWAQVEPRSRGKGPETTVLALQTRATLLDLRSIANALHQHVRECQILFWQLPFTSLVRAISPCPAQALDRHMRRSFSVTQLRPNGFSQIVNSDVEIVRMSAEEAEKRCELLHTAASAQIRALRDATNTDMVRAEMASWCSEQRLAEVVRRADALGVPSIWHLSHPLRNADPRRKFEQMMALHSVDPTAAVNQLVKLRLAHEEVVRRVESVGVALATVAANRVRFIVFPGTVQVDPEDDPQQTIEEATNGEILLARLCDSPDNPNDTSAVESQASVVVKLYNKALSQYDSVRTAQAGVVQFLEDLQAQVKKVNAQINALAAANGNLDPAAKTQVQLAFLHMQAVTREVHLATTQAIDKWYARSQRSANLAKSELERAARCVKEAEEMQTKAARIPTPTTSPAQADEGSGSGGGTSGGGGSGSGGGSSGGGGSGSGGGSSGGGKD